MANLRRVLFLGLFVLAFTSPTRAQTVMNGSFEADIVALDGTPLTATPEPGTLLMMGTGILGLAGMLRRKLP
jgi:hypothetical protein